MVDASGRGSSSPAWLESFGFAKPEEERIEIGIGYTTRVYRRRPTDLDGKLAVVVAGSGPNWRNGVVLYQTEDRWIVSIGGYFGDHAPDDDQMFAAYAGSLPTSDIYDIVAHAEPLSDFVRYRYPGQSAAALRAAGANSQEAIWCSATPVQLQSGLRPGHDGGGAGSRCCCANASMPATADLARRFFAARRYRDRYALGYRRRQRFAASAGGGAAPAEGALHQLVYRQAAHGRAARCKAGDRLSRGRQSGGAADDGCLQPAVVHARDPGQPLRRRSGGTDGAQVAHRRRCRRWQRLSTRADRSGRISRRSSSRRSVSSPPDSR